MNDPSPPPGLDPHDEEPPEPEGSLRPTSYVVVTVWAVVGLVLGWLWHPVAEQLASYRAAVDEVVLRVITPSDSLEDCLSFVTRAAELL